MPRDSRAGSRLLPAVALLVAIGGLALAATALPMLTGEAPAGGSLEDSADAGGAGEEAIERTDPETAGAAGGAAASAVADDPGAAPAGADPDEESVEAIREGIGDSEAGTALLGVAAVFATVGGAGEELPADAIREEDVEGVEDLEGYGQGQRRAGEREGDLGVPPGLGSLGGELGDLASESAPEGEGSSGTAPDAEDLEGIDGELDEGATEPGEDPDVGDESESEAGDAASGAGAGSSGSESGLFEAIPGGGTTVAAAFAALLALAVGAALQGGADARSLPGLVVSALLGAVVAASRRLEALVATVGDLPLRELPAALAGAVAGALAAIRTRLGGPGDSGGESPGAPAGDTPAGDEAPSAARGRIREAFAAVVAASSLSRTRIATPGDVARRAVESGAPREPVATITDAFRDVEYGGGDAEERVERVSEASEELEGRGEE
ncbi:DUF4129 domain-containing protein [Saliphagus sp. LR7]|uniref:DUF4129 domain-containing protein n=1 Tax=Saliphagus sp. LR7 TaxID=2282654 RepID=UPI000DF8019B|nr:DUF4129 domain-containing protein [Saliphagus sp. LR7]